MSLRTAALSAGLLALVLTAGSCVKIEVGIADKRTPDAESAESVSVRILEDALKNGTIPPETYLRVPKGADTAHEESTDSTDNTDETQSDAADEEVTVEREQLDPDTENKARDFAKVLTEYRRVWELENPYSWGYYENGYAFFDVDLDGEPEFLAQSGGGTMADCTTRVYKISEEGVPYLYTEGAFSYVDLSLYKDKREDGEWLYVENRYGRIGSERDFTFTGKFNIADGAYVFDEYFSVVNDYDADGNASVTYKFGGEEVSEEDYKTLYDSFFRLLKKKKVFTVFIAQSEVSEITDDSELKKVLSDAYALYESDYEPSDNSVTDTSDKENSETEDYASEEDGTVGDEAASDKNGEYEIDYDGKM